MHNECMRHASGRTQSTEPGKDGGKRIGGGVLVGAGQAYELGFPAAKFILSVMLKRCDGQKLWFEEYRSLYYPEKWPICQKRRGCPKTYGHPLEHRCRYKRTLMGGW